MTEKKSILASLGNTQWKKFKRPKRYTNHKKLLNKRHR